MTTKEIIEKVCKDNNLTFKMLAAATGLPEQYIYDINNGKIKKITAHKVGAFIKIFPQYPAMWLMTGNDDFLPAEGDSIHHNSAPVATRGAQINTSTTNNDQLIAQLKAQITALQSQITTLQAQIAELKADKQNLMQLLTNLTQNK